MLTLKDVGYVINDENYSRLRDVLPTHEAIIGGHKFPALDSHGDKRLLALAPSPHLRGAQPGAVKFANSGLKVIDKSARQAMVRELNARQAQIQDHIDFEPWDQNGLPYCWCNGGTQAASTKRRMQGLPFVHFSAASVGCFASDYRIRGGYGGETLEVLTKDGAVDAQQWGNNEVKRSLDTAATQENRKHHKVIEFIECESWDEVATCTVLGLPGSCDYNWWSHVVMSAGLTEDDDLIIRNSWGDWGTANKYGKYGFSTLQGGKKVPDYFFAVRQVTASEI